MAPQSPLSSFLAFLLVLVLFSLSVQEEILTASINREGRQCGSLRCADEHLQWESSASTEHSFATTMASPGSRGRGCNWMPPSSSLLFVRETKFGFTSDSAHLSCTSVSHFFLAYSKDVLLKWHQRDTDTYFCISRRIRMHCTANLIWMFLLLF